MFTAFKRLAFFLASGLLLSSTLSGCQSQPSLPGLGLQPARFQRLASAQRPPRRKLLPLRPDRLRVQVEAADAHLARGAGLPVKVDLRALDSAIDDQGELGSCTAFSIKAARELMLKRDGQPVTALSPLFLYYHERRLEGSIDEDAGADIGTGMKVLQTVGVAPEALWSYDPSNDNNPLTKEKFQLPPAPEAEQAAPGYRVAQVKALRTLRQIRTELAKRNPVVIGMEVFDAFNEPPGGLLAMPRPGEETQGGHAVLVVGYDDVRSLLIIRNSWSTAWGDQGYFYMPYEYVRRGLASDAWVASSR